MTRLIRRLLCSSSSGVGHGGKNTGTVMGLTKNADGKSRLSNDEKEAEADTSFEVLSLLQKNKNNSHRFSIRHIRNSYDSDSYIDQKAEADNDDEEKNKHKAPQHRRYLMYPTVGAGSPSQRYKMNQSQRLNKAVVNTNKVIIIIIIITIIIIIIIITIIIIIIIISIKWKN